VQEKSAREVVKMREQARMEPEYVQSDIYFPTFDNRLDGDKFEVFVHAFYLSCFGQEKKASQ
jgi:hypothetical protein